MGLSKQLSKITHCILQMSSDISVSSVASARNLGIIFDSSLSMSDHISYISKSCFSLVRDLRRIRYALDLNTAKTIATSLVHSRLDYCNSLFLNLPSSELNRLQLILNTAARAITKTPKFHHITPILKSLHRLKINQRIHQNLVYHFNTNLYNHNNLVIFTLVFHYKPIIALVLPLLSLFLVLLTRLV